jgi:nucleoside-diphosphate kinase
LPFFHAEHEGKLFFEPLLEFMESGPIVAFVAEGNRVIEGDFRKLAGVIDPTLSPERNYPRRLARDEGTKVARTCCSRFGPSYLAERN